MYQKTRIFHLILLGVSSSLVLFVKDRGWGTGGGGGLLNGQNQLSVTKVIESCRRSLKEKISQTLTEIKNKSEFQSATWSKYKHHKHS